MNYKKISVVLLVLAGFVACALYTHSVKKKIVYVKVEELYNDFEMKKELEATYVKVSKMRKEQIDSLELELKMLDKKITNEGEKKELVELFDEKRERYLMRKKQFEEDDAQMQDQYTAKIRKQLNQYVIDYGKENNCDYVLGAEGSGALMYAKDQDDVTKEVLTYINEKYKGVK